MPKKQFYFLCFLAILSLIFYTDASHGEEAANAINKAAPKNFTHFGMTLPAGWDGDEQSGFISDNRDEYMISVAKKTEDGDSYAAQVSIYFLPNVAGEDSETAARKLADAQADSSEPILQENGFWVFTGEPRTTIVRGLAHTMARTTPEKMLIIISQGEDEEARTIISSLHGLTPEARNILGR